MAKDEIPDGLIGVDIGPQTLRRYSEQLADAKMVVWNGPMGVSEIEAFAEGTRALSWDRAAVLE